MSRRGQEEELDQYTLRLTEEHHMHLKNYLSAPIEEKYHHFIQAMKVWRRLSDIQRYYEAHYRAVEYCQRIGKLRLGIPR